MIRDSLNTPSFSLNRLFVARGVVAVICLASLASLTGWAFAIPALRSLIPGAVEMKVNTALGLLLSGIALYLLVSKPTPITQRAAMILACAVAVIGAASLAEYLLNWQLGIDEMFVRDKADAY